MTGWLRSSLRRGVWLLVVIMLAGCAAPPASEDLSDTVLTRPSVLPALDASDPVRLQQLIDAGADPNEAIADGESPLILAAAIGSADCVHILAGAGADLEYRTLSGETALHLACTHADGDAAAVLLHAGARVDAINVAGSTPLHWAVLHRHPTTVNLLLDAGAAVDQPGPFSITPLLGAIIDSRAAKSAGESQQLLEVVLLLLAAGADPNFAPGRHLPPLCHAIISGTPAMVDALIRAGADINARCSEGCSISDEAQYRFERDGDDSARRILTIVRAAGSGEVGG
jgi:ankyrin repeat protein